MAPTIEEVLLYAIAQEGKRYILGAEADAADPDPPAFDCSELVQYACDRAGVDPRIPDGAYWQYRTCLLAGTLIPVPDGIATRGALLFRVTRNLPSRFDDVPHVAWSAGDGMTVEARGSAWGVGSWAAAGRFQAAGIIPGIDYTPGQERWPEVLDPNDPIVKDVLSKVNELVEAKREQVIPVLTRLDLARALNNPDELARKIAEKIPEASVTGDVVKTALEEVLREGVG